ncbi:hypothetical protein D3C72_1011000 [compost metagenome]
MQRGEEEQEVVADLLPDRGKYHQEHRLAAVLRVVPVVAEFAEEMGNQPTPWVKQEDPQHGGDGRRDGVGQQHQRLIETAAAHHVIHQRRKKQRHDEAADRHHGAEFDRRPEGVEVIAVMEQRGKVIQTDKLAGKPERIDALYRVPERFARRPDKKDDGDNQLRGDQQIGQPARTEYRTGG